MNDAFYIGATGLQAQQRALEVIANNVANLNTGAFKRSEVRFAELISEIDQRPNDGMALPALSDVLGGVRVESSSRIFEQGDLRQTGKPLDLAISGEGLVEVLGAGGEVWLWRGGSLRVNSDGLLETDSGLVLREAIQVPTDSTGLVIDRDGKVRASIPGQADTAELGSINLVMPRDTRAVEALGNGLYRVASDDDLQNASGGENGGGVFVQGSLEASNVQLTNEMVTMLLMQRAYGANAQVVQAGDQLMAIANGLRRQ